MAERHGVTIETRGEAAATTGSPALLLQLTQNLVHNAIVHNLPGKGSVWVGTAVHAGTVTLTVENTGEKITPQLASTLTEPFQRGTGRVHRDQAGVGLGLAIVKTIAVAHDGTLTLTPRPDCGIRVTVELPRRIVRVSGTAYVAATRPGACRSSPVSTSERGRLPQAGVRQPNPGVGPRPPCRCGGGHRNFRDGRCLLRHHTPYRCGGLIDRDDRLLTHRP